MIANREVKVRPKLAKILEEDLEFMLGFYHLNFREAYYLVLSIVNEKKGNIEASNFYRELAKAYRKGTLHYFEEEYSKELNEIELISEARAFYSIKEIYAEELNHLIDKIDMSELSKLEVYMIKDFYHSLLAPTRNPNIEIKEGNTKCWYDREGRYYFEKDLKLSVEHLERVCRAKIESFQE